MTHLADELAGRYRLEELLSRGGMGEVWRAQDTRLGRPVAVKLLTTGLAEVTDRERFLREARLAAQLSHPNVVAVYDVGEREGRPYLVMELLDGRTLGDELALHGPLPVAEVRSIGAQIAMGLGAAHAIDVIHRDVKPRNLFRTTDGTVKVLDFGIARLTDDAATRLTRTGLVVGTAAYVAPEQLTLGEVDARSDLYSLGCVLHELLTGQPPFSGGMATLAYAHVHEEPELPSRLRQDIPRDLEDLLLAMLAKDPATRPASARVVATHLGAQPAVPPAPEPALDPGGERTATIGLPPRPDSGTDVLEGAAAPAPSDGTGVLPASQQRPRRPPAGRLVPLLTALVVVLLVLLVGLIWLGSPSDPGRESAGSGTRPAASDSPSPSSPPPAEPTATPTTPSRQETDPPELQIDLPEVGQLVGSEGLLRDLDEQLKAAVASGQLDEESAEDIRDAMRDVRESWEEGKEQKVRQKVEKLIDKLEKAEGFADEQIEGGEHGDGNKHGRGQDKKD